MHAVLKLLSCDLVPTILLLEELGYSSIEDIRMYLPFVDTPSVDAFQKATQMLIDLEALAWRGMRCPPHTPYPHHRHP